MMNSYESQIAESLDLMNIWGAKDREYFLSMNSHAWRVINYKIRLEKNFERAHKDESKKKIPMLDILVFCYITLFAQPRSHTKLK